VTCRRTASPSLIRRFKPLDDPAWAFFSSAAAPVVGWRIRDDAAILDVDLGVGWRLGDGLDPVRPPGPITVPDQCSGSYA